MTELPTGTVTFLFTDIEGSTQFLSRLGERYAEVLAGHRRVVRESFVRHGGVEVDTQGDAFLYAFSRASDAVAAAEEAQQALADGPLQARIGIHTGEPQVTTEGYVGMDVHHGSRICSAAHGGQILVSQATRELLDDEVVLRDVGEHRLKDFINPAHLYQLGSEEFPPPRSLNWSNLPVQPTPLVGRERELREAGALLRRADVRLLTLVGPGGVGKTRLALQLAAEAAHDFRDGVWWIPLAGIRSCDLVVPTIEQTVGAQDGVTDHLRSKQTLLVLDNFEHVIDAAVEIAPILGEAPDVRAIVTSREPLHLSGERQFQVPPLAELEAVELFTERARDVRADFQADDAVTEICGRLDALPLPIELAAARVSLMPPPVMLERLARSLSLLTGGPRDAPERQRTVRATIEWSFDLLDEQEQRLFVRLAVFAGGFTLEAAEDVCEAGLDTLQSLVEKNLVRSEGGRFSLLETVREYALERLESSRESDEIGLRHADHYLACVEQWDAAPEQWDQAAVWVDAELDNIRAALACLAKSGSPTNSLRLAAAMQNFWLPRGALVEGRRDLTDALARGERSAPALRAYGLSGLARIAWRQGDLEVSRRSAEQAVELYRGLDDAPGLGYALLQLASTLMSLGDYADARRYYQETAQLARSFDGADALNLYITYLNNRGNLEMAEGDYDTAAELFREGLELRRTHWGHEGATLLTNLGVVTLLQSRPEEALAYYLRGLELGWERRNIHTVCYGLEGVAAASAASGGDLVKAARLLGAAEATRDATGAPITLSTERDIHDRCLATIRSELGRDQLAQALEEGRRLELADAVRSAVSGRE